MKMERTSNSKVSWPKVGVRKRLNVKDEFHSDYYSTGGTGKYGGEVGSRKSFSDKDCYIYVPNDFSGWLYESGGDGLKRAKIEPEVTDKHNLRMMVGTWNVGGKTPDDGLDLGEWLMTSSPADIYVLGFQEVVPLNAGNIIGAEDKGPAAKWLNLISQALNRNTALDHDLDVKEEDDQMKNHKRRLSFSDLLSVVQEDYISTSSSSGDERRRFENGPRRCLSMGRKSNTSTAAAKSKRRGPQKYSLMVSKQMVGIFVCVWVRTKLSHHITDISLSSVGRGIMGYLGNKGSISISMKLYSTSTFCFICSHLTSGEKQTNQLRRNLDVMEILRRTRFYKTRTTSTILDHDNIIWLGDLNYRLNNWSTNNNTSLLMERHDWGALLQKDQLRIEQRDGRVFDGFQEGEINFPPTYKYVIDSDEYATKHNSKSKPRNPAWCDRILWRGEEVKQMIYSRGESRFSDHRPVYSMFEINVKGRRKCNNYRPPSVTRHTGDCISISRSCTLPPIIEAGSGVVNAANAKVKQTPDLLLVRRLSYIPRCPTEII